MQAYRLVAPQRFELQEVSDPAPEAGEALVRIERSLICGTDLHLARDPGGFITLPITLGHEIYGVVEAVTAPDRQAPAVGAQVVVEPQIVCLACPQCRAGRYNLCENLRHVGMHVDGGFATHLAVPFRNLHEVPAGIDPVLAALTEPVAVCLNGTLIGRITAGDRVAVVGDGVFGLIFCLLAKRMGAAAVVLCGHHPESREQAARRLGADAFVDTRAGDAAAAVREALGGLPSVVIDAAGSKSAAALCVQIAGPAARVVVFGLASGPTEISWADVLLKELEILGSRSSNHRFPEALRIVVEEAGRLRPLITHTLPFARFEEAFELTRSKAGGAIKVALDLRG